MTQTPPVAAVSSPQRQRPFNAASKGKPHWCGDGDKALAESAEAYRKRVKVWAEADCALTSSGVITAEHVRQAELLLAVHPPGAAWLVLEALVPACVGFGVNLLSKEDSNLLAGGAFLGGGILLFLFGAIATRCTPYSDWWRKVYRLPRSRSGR